MPQTNYVCAMRGGKKVWIKAFTLTAVDRLYIQSGTMTLSAWMPAEQVQELPAVARMAELASRMEELGIRVKLIGPLMTAHVAISPNEHLVRCNGASFYLLAPMPESVLPLCSGDIVEKTKVSSIRHGG